MPHTLPRPRTDAELIEDGWDQAVAYRPVFSYRYDPRCQHCVLGLPHTRHQHNRAVAEVERYAA